MLRSRPVVALVALVTLAQTLAGCGAAPSSSGAAAEPRTATAASDDSSPRQYTATETVADEAAPVAAGAAAPMAQQPVNPSPTMMAPPEVRPDGAV